MCTAVSEVPLSRNFVPPLSFAAVTCTRATAFMARWILLMRCRSVNGFGYSEISIRIWKSLVFKQINRRKNKTRWKLMDSLVPNSLEKFIQKYFAYTVMKNMSHTIFVILFLFDEITIRLGIHRIIFCRLRCTCNIGSAAYARA